MDTGDDWYYEMDRGDDPKWIGGLYCVQSSMGAPEQWFLYADEESAEEDWDRERWVGYVRIRHGIATTDTRLLGIGGNSEGEIWPELMRVYSPAETPIGGGCFESPEIREAWLEESARRVRRWWSANSQELHGGPELWRGRAPGSDPGGRQVKPGRPMWNALEEVARQVRGRHCKRIGVHGSVARGDDARWSDVNLVVSEPEESWDEVKEAIAYLVEIETGRCATMRIMQPGEQGIRWLGEGGTIPVDRTEDPDRTVALASRTYGAHLREIQEYLEWAMRVRRAHGKEEPWQSEQAAEIARLIPAGAKVRYPEIGWARIELGELEDDRVAEKLIGAVRAAREADGRFWQRPETAEICTEAWPKLREAAEEERRWEERLQKESEQGQEGAKSDESKGDQG